MPSTKGAVTLRPPGLPTTPAWVSWALRAVGRRSRHLNAVAVAVAQRLPNSPQAAARWVGKDAQRELTGSVVPRRLITDPNGKNEHRARKAPRRSTGDERG